VLLVFYAILLYLEFLGVRNLPQYVEFLVVPNTAIH